MIANDRCAAFIGGYDGLDDGRHAKLVMQDCTNYGNITATTDNAGAIVSNSYAFYSDWSNMTEESTKEWVSLTNVKNYGIIRGKTAMAFAGTSSDHLLAKVYQDAVGGTYISDEGALKNVTAQVYFDNGNFYIVGSDNKYSYPSFSAIVGEIQANGGKYNTRSMDFSSIGATIKGTQITSAHAYDKNKAIEKGIIDENIVLDYKYSCTSFKVAIVEKDGVLYLIFDNNEVTSVDCNVALYVKGYNVSNEFVGTIKI